MAHVEELEELALAVGPGGVVALGDLPPAGDAGPAGEELVPRVPELVGLGLGHGPGPDHGEVALEDVQELGGLVEGGAPQQAAHPRHARVVVHLLLALPLGELGPVEIAPGVAVGVGIHGAELEDANRPAALSHALLAEDGAAGRVQPYDGAQDQRGHQADQAHRAGEDDVEGALYEAVAEPAPPWGRDARVGRWGDELLA
mgnify:CR=1 FL=1